MKRRNLEAENKRRSSGRKDRRDENALCGLGRLFCFFARAQQRSSLIILLGKRQKAFDSHLNEKKVYHRCGKAHSASFGVIEKGIGLSDDDDDDGGKLDRHITRQAHETATKRK